MSVAEANATGIAFAILIVLGVFSFFSWMVERERAKKAERDGAGSRLAADRAEADAARDRAARVRMANYIQNTAALREPDSLAAEGWLLVDEAREQLDRVAWVLVAKLSPTPVDVVDRATLRYGAYIAGWDVSAWLRRADALHDAVKRQPGTTTVGRAPWIDPERRVFAVSR